MIKELIKKHYGITVKDYSKLSLGAGSNTYRVSDINGYEYLLKNTNINEANNPQNEPKLCEHLCSKGISVSEFIKDINGEFVWYEQGKIYHMQKFVSGENYGMHSAPCWLMEEIPKTLGKIHTALTDYDALPVGIGDNFFKYMTPNAALQSYRKSYEFAVENSHKNVADDLLYRIKLMESFSVPEIDLSKLTLSNTHGDYFISQIICTDKKIAAVIDWTTACIHPVVWEIIRSYIYSCPDCKDGNIDIPNMVEYTGNYMKYASLNKDDLKMMPYIFYYQISVCDYYNQYFSSSADNRYIYLEQAILSTKLMKWFERYAEDLSASLSNLKLKLHFCM